MSKISASVPYRQEKRIKYLGKDFFWLHKLSFSLLQPPMLPHIWIAYYNSVISKKNLHDCIEVEGTERERLVKYLLKNIMIHF